MTTGVFEQDPEHDDQRFKGYLAPATIAKISRISPASAYRQQILAEFIARYRSANDQSSGGKGETGSWLMSLPILPDYSKALESTMLAIATAKLGRVSRNEALRRESLKFYVNGLFELQKALWDPDSMYKDDTLGACMAMVMYEVIECPDETMAAWAAHMKGCARMFEMRGAEAYKSDFSYELFLPFRFIEVCCSPSLMLGSLSNSTIEGPTSFRGKAPYFPFWFGLD